MGKSVVGDNSAYSLCFFLGPGLPRSLGSPFPFAAAAPALLLTPFFLGPSAGGPMPADWAAGVPSAGGELAAESVPFSAWELGAAAAAAPVVVVGVAEGAGDGLAGASSMTESGSATARSLWGGTLRVTTKRPGLEAAAPPAEALAVMPFDFRRSLGAAALLAEGAIADSENGTDAMVRWGDGWNAG